MNMIAAAIAQENLAEAWRSPRSTENVLKIELQHIPTAAEFRSQPALALQKLSGVVRLPSLQQSGPLDEVLVNAKAELQERVNRLALAPPQWWCDERNRNEFIGAFRGAQGAVYADIPGLPQNASLERHLAAEDERQRDQAAAMGTLRAAQAACSEREGELLKQNPDQAADLLTKILLGKTINDPKLVAAKKKVAEALAAVEALDYRKPMIDPKDVPKVLTTRNDRADAKKMEVLISQLQSLSRRADSKPTKRIAAQIAAKTKKLNLLRLRESYGRFGARGTVTKLLAETAIAERYTNR